jgi:hypothetical protein
LRSATVILVSCQTRGPSLLQTESSLRLACSVLPCPFRADRDPAVPDHMPSDVHHLPRRLEVIGGVARGLEPDTDDLKFAG